MVSAPTLRLSSAGRVEGQDLAVVHDRHPVAELVGFFHVVGGQHDRLPLGVEVPQEIPQRQAALGVESRRRLVEEEDGRTVEDGSRHHEALRHAAREGVDRCLGEACELKLLQQLVGDLLSTPAPIPNRRPWK